MFGIKTALREENIQAVTLFTILVATLGYFVDVFDLFLFSIVRVPSLKALNVPATDMLSTGILLINCQMAGLLLGGIFWGVWGDRIGRRSVLFGSILLYSIANIANGFVHDVTLYAVLRFIAGMGLAGELGAGVTLASELLPARLRGLGTAFLTGFGVLGAAFGVIIAAYTDWRTAYIVGGAIGLALLVMRVNVAESALHEKLMAEAPDTARGNVLIFFRQPKLLRRLLKVIWVGGPIWAINGLLITFTPEFAKAMGMTVIPTAGNAVLSYFIGASIGNVLVGLASQKLQSRRKALFVWILLQAVSVALYMTVPHGDAVGVYYAMCGLMGLTSYWAMFVQIGAEQFGTNIRATAATCAPNFVRAITIPCTAGFHVLVPMLGVIGSGSAIVGLSILIALIALGRLQETFGKNLDFQDT